MKDDSHSALFRRITRLRWQVAILAFILVLAHQYIEHRWLFVLPRWQHFWTQVAFYGLVGPILAWLALESIRRQVETTEQTEQELRDANAALEESNQRLEFLIEVERRLAKADDEEELIERMLTLPSMVLPALGCSLIRFDEAGQPRPPVHHGELPPEAFQNWAVHLSDPAAQHACQTCESRWASDYAPCPLLDAAQESIRVRKVHCLALGAHGREIGVLNIYLHDFDRPTESETVLLETMANGMSLAFASQTLRARELATLSQLQRLDRYSAIEEQLEAVLEQTVNALEADGGVILVRANEKEALELIASAGGMVWDPPTQEMLLGLAASVRTAAGALTLHDFDHGMEHNEMRSMIIAPLRVEDRWLGSLSLWSEMPQAFVRRQMRVLEALASQVGLLIENQRLYREVEFEAGLAERTRLAREIHDGLAQTLGYLKLRTARIMSWMRSGAEHRAQEGLEDLKFQLDAAYVDAREAIDGLSIDMRDGDFADLLAEITEEFHALAKIPIRTSPAPGVELGPEVQVQLLRIIQEALGNIRKHASASQAAIEWSEIDGGIVLQIRDDGCGFDPEDVPPISKHGLRIMRERADLLGAEFQLTSEQGVGTAIEIRMPMAVEERGDEYPRG